MSIRIRETTLEGDPPPELSSFGTPQSRTTSLTSSYASTNSGGSQRTTSQGSEACWPREPEGPLGPSSWVPDHKRHQCVGCLSHFGFLTRRHHCRGCGEVFCGTCCPVHVATQERAEMRLCEPCCSQRKTSQSNDATWVIVDICEI